MLATPPYIRPGPGIENNKVTLQFSRDQESELKTVLYHCNKDLRGHEQRCYFCLLLNCLF
jgi:hypothetical protein